MSQIRRDVAIFIGLFVGVSVVEQFASYFWFKTIISGRIFSADLIHWPMLLSWIPAALLFGAAGVMLAATLQSEAIPRWALAFGGLNSVIRLGISSFWFSDNSGLFEYFWAFAGYAVPPLACVAGALYAQRHAANRLRNP